MFGLGTAKDCRRRAKRVRGNKRGRLALGRMHERLELRLALTAAHGDFNGDGYMDLAIGVPGEDVGAIVDAGAVNVSVRPLPHSSRTRLCRYSAKASARRSASASAMMAL